jgi:hypothetical protein
MHQPRRIHWFAACVAAAASLILFTAAADAGKKDKKKDTARRADAVEVAPGLLRSPYLQSPGLDSILVVWDASDPAEPAIDFGPGPDYGMSMAATSDGRRRVATLRGLQPGTTYHYRLRAGARILAEGPEFVFRTAPRPDQGPVSFFVTGDVGEEGGEQTTTAASILRAAPRPEFGLVCGDAVYDDGRSEDYDRNLMRPWKDLLRTIPVWPALGNHDWHTDPESNWRREWYLPNNEHYYSFDWGNAHFVALDTRDEDIYDLDAQVAWLERDLQANGGADWLFVFFHHPGLTCTYKKPTPAVVQHLLPIFDRYHVDVVFTGHAHTYERLFPIRDGKPVSVDQDPRYVDPEGTIYVVSGAGAKLKKGKPTRRCGPTAFFRDQTIVWTHVSVDGGRCTIRTRQSEDDALVDEISITKTRVGSRASRP